MADPQDYEIRRATVADRERCFEFTKRAFFPDEPIHLALNETKGPEKIGDVNGLKYLGENTSFLAFKRGTNGEEIILGICLNGDSTSQVLERRENLLRDGLIENATSRKITRLLVTVMRKVNIWDKYGADTSFDINIVAVDRSYRGRGLGRILMETSLRLAEELKYSLVYVECTSFYSARLCEQLGMTCELSMPYAEYKDGGSEPVFSPPQPHTHFKTFIKQINEKSD